MSEKHENLDLLFVLLSLSVLFAAAEDCLIALPEFECTVCCKLLDE